MDSYSRFLRHGCDPDSYNRRINEWHSRGLKSQPLIYLTATLAAVSMEVAAIMGHLNGWILDFGDFPGIIGKYSSSAGFSSIKDFSDALMGSHSHEMVVSFMAMVAVLLVLQFGYQEIQKAPRIVVNIGLAMVAIGIVATIVVYIAAGFVNWGPPN